jgi:hypothetical protein
MTNIYNLFKFIENKEPEYRYPLKLKLFSFPDDVTKEDLHVKGDFETSRFYNDDDDDADYEGLFSLPDGMTIDGHLSIGKDLKSLPNNLTVRKSLTIFDGNKISSLPKDLKVEGNLTLWENSLLNKYSEEEIRKMAPGIKGEIKYSSW